MVRTRVALVLCTLLVAGLLAPAHAADPDSGTLTPGPGLVTWSGSFDGVFPLAPSPDVVCLTGDCDTFTLTVALRNLWEIEDGAVEVAIRWAYDGVTDLDLIVSKDGAEVARSAAVDSNAESVFIPEAPDGEYTVTIVPTNNVGDAGPAPVAYEGLAEVELFGTDGDGDDMLPNLVALPPRNFHISTSAYHLFPFPENPLLSCYPEETLESDAHPTRCLRFDQSIANTGTGPLELRFLVSNVLSPNEEDHRLMQRITMDDGGFRERLADSYELHAIHGHVHYKGFSQSFLYPYDWSAQAQTGDGTPSSVGNKVGFCVIDVELLNEYWGATPDAKQNGPRTRTFPTCLTPTEQEGNDLWMVQGINVGWADTYGWNLADQYIDITGIPDGIYELELVANPTGSILEATDEDNRASTIICLQSDVASAVESDEDAAGCGA